MYKLLISILVSSILVGINLPKDDQELFVAEPASDSPIESVGGDLAYDNRLPLAENKALPPQKIDQNSLGVKVTAQSGIVIDWDTGRVLWQKEYLSRRSIASLTKLMTALVFLDNNPGWNERATILAQDQRDGGVSFFYTGEEVAVRDLFYVSLVRSVNCAAAALARVTGLSEEEFTAQMNQKAADLGMNDTHFVEPTGLQSGNVSTAQDVAILLREALSVDAIANATILPAYSATILNKEETRSAVSTDDLLSGFLNQPPYKVWGGKTGYLVEAGYCFALAVEKDGHRVISVMLGSDSADSRFIDSKGIIDWVFRNYQWQ